MSLTLSSLDFVDAIFWDLILSAQPALRWQQELPVILRFHLHP